MSFTVTTRVDMAHLRGRRQLNPPGSPHPTATSPVNPTTTSAVRGEASLDLCDFKICAHCSNGISQDKLPLLLRVRILLTAVATPCGTVAPPPAMSSASPIPRVTPPPVTPAS